MKITPLVRSVCATLGILLATAALAQQQKYRLRDRAARGDVAVVDSTGEFVLDLNISIEGQDPQQMRIASYDQERYTEEVLAVVKGVPTALRRKYAIKRTREEDSTEGPTTTTSALQGKTVVVRWRNGKAVITGVQNLTADERKELSAAVSPDEDTGWPQQPLAIGQEWELDDDAAAARYGFPPGLGEFKCRLIDVVKYGGHRAAKIGITGQLTMPDPEGSGEMNFQVRGTAFQSLQTDRPLSLVASGPVIVKSDTIEDGKKVQVRGTGKLQFKETVRWTRIGGKPVVPRRR